MPKKEKKISIAIASRIEKKNYFEKKRIMVQK